MRPIVWRLTTLVTAAAALATGAAAASAQAVAPAAPAAATITYIGSSGFLLSAGGKKILIDALFDGYEGAYVVPAAVREPLLAGRAPFDGIDLILATHAHGDHFSAGAVRRALESNPRAIFVGPAAAAAMLTGLGDRVRALEVPEGQRRTLEVNGITVTAMPLSHGTPPAGTEGVVNLAYLVTAGGTKFFHTGDIDARIVMPSHLQALGIADERVDAAFVPHFLLSTPYPIELVTEGIRPRVVVASHLQYTGGPPDAERIRRNFPGALLFGTEGESRPVP